MISVLYYYYYLFYTRILPDDQPHATVVFTLGFTLSLIINCIVNIILAYIANISLGKWEMLGLLAIVLVILYFVYHKNGKGKKIVKEKPMILNNTVSIIFTILIFILAMLALFLQADITRNILENH
jgi:hypothetical protein